MHAHVQGHATVITIVIFITFGQAGLNTFVMLITLSVSCQAHARHCGSGRERSHHPMLTSKTVNKLPIQVTSPGSCLCWLVDSILPWCLCDVTLTTKIPTRGAFWSFRTHPKCEVRWQVLLVELISCERWSSLERHVQLKPQTFTKLLKENYNNLYLNRQAL